MDFEKQYFDRIYNEEYDRRNPPYKFRSYFRECSVYAPDGGSLLDIGCAYGSFLKVAHGHFELHGSDISNHAISIARERLPSAHLVVSDVLNLPEERQFNLITCFDILEHVENITSALQKISRLMAKDSFLVMSVPVYDTVIGHLVGKLDKDPTHVHKNSRHWWIETLHTSGFDVLEWKGIWRYYLKPFYLHYCSKSTRSVSPAILLIAKRRL